MNSTEKKKGNKLGIGWTKKEGKYLNQSISKEKFNQLPVDEHGSVNITAILLESPDERVGNTHLVVSDDFKKKDK